MAELRIRAARAPRAVSVVLALAAISAGAGLLAIWQGAYASLLLTGPDAIPVPLTAASSIDPCTGAIVGRVITDYGSHAPAAGEWISLSGLDSHRPGALVNSNTRTGPDGSFRVADVPVGQYAGAARHARFNFTLEQCGQTLNVGIVRYPLVHPTLMALTCSKVSCKRDLIGRITS